MTDRDEKNVIDARRRNRNYVLGGVLLGFAILFFAITIVRMG